MHYNLESLDRELYLSNSLFEELLEIKNKIFRKEEF